MTEQMAAGVRGLDPMAVGRGLYQEVGAVEQEHPDMQGLCDNATLVNSVLATRFLKLAGGVKDGKRRLSPAAVQVAFGANFDELYAFNLGNPAEAKKFDRRATEILKESLRDQPILEQVCLIDDGVYDQMKQRLDALGWGVQTRNGPAGKSIASDPVVCGRLLAGNLACPQDKRSVDGGGVCSDLKVAREVLAAQRRPATPAQVAAAFVDAEMAVLKQLAAMLPAPGDAGMQTRLTRNDADLRADAAIRNRLHTELIDAAVQAHTTAWQGLCAGHVMADGSEIETKDFNAAARGKNPYATKDMLDKLNIMIRQRTAIPRQPPQQAPPPQQQAPAQGGPNG